MGASHRFLVCIRPGNKQGARPPIASLTARLRCHQTPGCTCPLNPSPPASLLGLLVPLPELLQALLRLLRLLLLVLGTRLVLEALPVLPLPSESCGDLKVG